MTTDAHVIAPLFFPGGDIGSLAVHGAINDVAMAGARPLYLSAAFVLEEGFPLADLDRIVASMARASREAGAPVITGDTKVVEKGKGDGVFITTTGIGVVPEGVHISGDRASPGDAILVSGTLGDHGIAVLSKRENLEFETEILSDSAALHGLVADMVAAVPCNPLPARPDARRARLDAERNRAAIARRHAPCRERDPVQGRRARGLRTSRPRSALHRQRRQAHRDLRKGDAGRLLSAMRAHPLGRDAAIIGEVVADRSRLRPDADPVRRKPHGGLAARRPPAADLLRLRQIWGAVPAFSRATGPTP